MKKIKILLAALTVGMCANAQQTLNLDECISLALQNNRSLQNAALDIEAGKEQQKEMRAKYLPEISANALAFHAFDKLIKGDGTYPQEIAALETAMPGISQLAGESFSFAELNRGYSASLSAMLPLYAGGQITNANKLARVGSEIASLQQLLTQKEVVQKVTENYWQIVQLKYNLQTLDAAQHQLDAVQQQVSDFVETGVTTRNALLKVHLRQQELASNRLKVQNADRLLRMLLAQQIGVKEVDIQIPDKEPLYAPPSLADNSSHLRPELQMASKAVEAQNLQVKLEQGKYLPTVAVGVMGFHSGFGGLSENVRSYANTDMTNGIALASVSIPISGWFGGTHAIRRAKIKLQQTQNDYLNAQEQLRIDTESSRLSAVEAYEQIKIAQASVEEAAENLRMATELYHAGRSTITDLLDAETLNRQSRNNLSSAIAAYQVKLADYRRKVE